MIRHLTGRRGALIAVLAVAALGTGCKRDNAGSSDALAQDSTLSRDLQLANRDTTVQPQLKDVPNTPPPAPPSPAPVTRRPAPAPAQPVARPSNPVRTPPRPQVSNAVPSGPPVSAPTPTTASGNTVESRGSGNTEGRVGVVSAGTTLALSAGQRVCTNTNRVGDRMTATLSEAVTGSNGVVIPAGATAVVEITSLGESNQAGENMNIGLVVRSISYGGKSYPVDGEITHADVEKVKSANNNDATKVLGGAAVGAILGRVLGGRSKTKGTIIGAAGGAAAGAVIANQTAKYDACIPSGGSVAVRLDSPMSIQASGNTQRTTSTAPPSTI